jgi:hypothetical protein
VTVADSWTASFSPAGDAAFGGADNNVVPGSASLSVVSGVTTVSFSRYLRASDAVDTAIGTGATPITFAYGSSAVPSYHGLQCVRRCARAILGAPRSPGVVLHQNVPRQVESCERAARTLPRSRGAAVINFYTGNTICAPSAPSFGAQELHGVVRRSARPPREQHHPIRSCAQCLMTATVCVLAMRCVCCPFHR